MMDAPAAVVPVAGAVRRLSGSLMRHLLLIGFAVGLLLGPSRVVAAQAARQAEVKQIRELTANGQFDEARALVDRLLDDAPKDATLQRLKLEALVGARDQASALTTYDGFLKVNGTDRPALLQVLARGELWQQAAEPGADAFPALEVLAKSGDATASRRLEEIATSGKPPMDAVRRGPNLSWQRPARIIAKAKTRQQSA